MVKIVLVSDLHGRPLTTQSADVLIAAGDMTEHGQEDEFIELNRWFGAQPQALKIYVPGNHDILAYRNPALVREILSNAVVLIDEEIEVSGSRIYGSPWVRSNDSDWAFPLMDGTNRAKEKWAEIPEGLDILVTHGPPYGIGDRSRRTREHVGDGLLLNRLRAMTARPAVHVFGHIHEGERVTGKLEMLFVNASICDEHGQAVKTPVVIERNLDGCWKVLDSSGS